jgi:hypothetical protein
LATKNANKPRLLTLLDPIVLPQLSWQHSSGNKPRLLTLLDPMRRLSRSPYPQTKLLAFSWPLFRESRERRDTRGEESKRLKCCINNKLRYRLDFSNFRARLAQQLSIHAQTFNLKDLQLHLKCIGLKLATHFWRTFSGMRICQQGKPCEVLNPRPLPCQYADPPSRIALIPLLQPRNKFRG